MNKTLDITLDELLKKLGKTKEDLVMGISSMATEYVVNQPSTVFLLLFRIRFLRCT